MKKIITSFLLFAAITATAQTRVVDHAVITTKTTIVSPEGADDNMPAPPAGPDGGEVRVMRFGGDGETKSVTTIKGDLVKTFIETDMSRTTVIRDNGKKITTTLMEIMGSKNGFYATDEEQEQMSKKMDSMMQSRRQGDNAIFANNNAVTGTEIIYAEGSKKIAGMNCKKAYIVSTRKNGSKDSSTVWYSPDFKIQGLASTGGTSSFGSFGRVTGLGGLNGLEGFPMQYETKMNRGRKMIVEVTKINIEKEVTDKEFEIPKDFVLKPMKELQNGFGGMQFRMGGPGQ